MSNIEPRGYFRRNSCFFAHKFNCRPCEILHMFENAFKQYPGPKCIDTAVKFDSIKKQGAYNLKFCLFLQIFTI